jgi:microcystin-dependent protein
VRRYGPFDQLGQVKWFGTGFVPGDFLPADGRLLPITGNEALFARLRTSHGGDGRSTFALPDLRGRTAVGTGGRYSLGRQMGSAEVTLNEGNLPRHGHETATGPSTTVGSGVAFENRQPGVALDFRINPVGSYPTRDGGGATTPEETMAFVTMDAASPTSSSWQFPTNGGLISIGSNPALFSLLGTQYGGDGRTTFALPDLRDRIAVGVGTGPGLTPRSQGQVQGSAETLLGLDQLPLHVHSDPDAGGVTAVAGGGQPFVNIQPELSLRYVVALSGIYPSRDGGGGGFEPYLGEIALFAGTFAPRGWANADGRLLPISTNAALFSLFGTTFGGDGRTTFALPDLRGRTPVGAGGTLALGQRLGSEAVTLTMAQMPEHGHSVERALPPPPAVVPLPGGLALMAGSLGALGLAGWRRSRHAA